jgi:hypothetical protein
VKTETFISMLAADRTVATRPTVALSIAVAIGFAVAAIGFLLALGIRPDAAAALGTLRFLFKFVVTLALFAAGVRLALALSTPGADAAKPARLFALPAVLLVGAVAAELMVVPAGAWATRLVGTNARVCLVAIPALALGPLAAVLLALRSAAPTAPSRAGAAAGLVAAALAATLYASHCIDDSPLFVAVWYSLAIILVVAAGAWLGPRVLRW